LPRLPAHGGVYPLPRGIDARLCGIAAAHHRFAWVHLFAVCKHQPDLMSHMLDFDGLRERMAALW
jgi:hypothetical protein